MRSPLLILLLIHLLVFTARLVCGFLLFLLLLAVFIQFISLSGFPFSLIHSGIRLLSFIASRVVLSLVLFMLLHYSPPIHSSSNLYYLFASFLFIPFLSDSSCSLIISSYSPSQERVSSLPSFTHSVSYSLILVFSV